MDKKVLILAMMATLAVQAAIASEAEQAGASNGEKRIETPGDVVDDQSIATPDAPTAAAMIAVPGPEVSRADTRKDLVRTR